MAEEEKTTDVLLWELANAINTQEISTGKLMEELRGIIATSERAVVARLAARVGPLTMTAEREMWIREMAIPGWYTREPIAEIDALRAQVAALREERDKARRERDVFSSDTLRAERDAALARAERAERGAHHDCDDPDCQRCFHLGPALADARARVASLESSLAAFRDCIPRPEPTADVLAVIRDLWTGHKHTPESAAAHVEAIVESRLAAARAAHERLREAAETYLSWRSGRERLRAALSPATAQAETHNGHVFPTATDSACTRCGAWTAMEPCPAHVEGEKQGGGG